MSRRPFLSLNAQIGIVQGSGHFQPAWYRQTYPDVGMSGLYPAEHYVKYGAPLGRDAGRGFSGALYLETYPDAARSGLNPLVHYETIGREAGYRAQAGYGGPRARQDVARIRYKLLNLGITDRALAEMEAMADTHPHEAGRVAALHELAMWHMRQDTEAGYRAALSHVARARERAVTTELRSRLANAELLCWHFLSDRDAGLRAWDRAVRDGDVDPDVLLARANLEPDPESRLVFVNLMMQHFALPPVTLEGDGATPYDRLATTRTIPPAADGPLVSVLLATYEAADVLPTALRSLQEQSWRNLEILVLDDCGSDDTPAVVQGFARSDPRIRYVRMERNGGAYVARNHGLDLARGKYVTLHDADDWSHPLKIETQLRHMEATSHSLGCMSMQARATPDLQFIRWAGRCRTLIQNVSSFMFRREAMRTHFGYWDTVRVSADNELIERMRAKFGRAAVRELETGPLSFQREGETSAISDKALGVKGFKFGVRRDYLAAQRLFHRESADLRYGSDPRDRAFAVPAIMRPERARLAEDLHHRDVVLAGDLRVRDCGAEIEALARRGTVGLVEIYDYDALADEDVTAPVLPGIRRRIDGETVRMIAFGERAACRLLVVMGLDVLRDRQRYVPAIDADEVAVLVDAIPPDPGDWIANLQACFGPSATLHPATGAVRRTLAGWDLPAGIVLSPTEVTLGDILSLPQETAGGVPHETHPLRRIERQDG